MTLRILDPRATAEGEALRLAPATKSLTGAVVGMIDNGKIGTARFFEHVADILAGPEETLAELLDRADAGSGKHAKYDRQTEHQDLPRARG